MESSLISTKASIGDFEGWQGVGAMNILSLSTSCEQGKHR